MVVGAEPCGRTWTIEGLRVVERVETNDWRACQRAFVAMLRERRDDLVADLGNDVAAALMDRPWDDAAGADIWHGMVAAEWT